MSVKTTVAIVIAVSTFTVEPAQKVAGQVRAPEGRPEYQIMSRGALSRELSSVRLTSVPLRLEIRNIVIGPRGSEGVTLPARAVLELRSGAIVTTIDGEARERRVGDFWTVEAGRVMQVRNHSEAAVIRVIYLHEGTQ